jgi:hypothetical protein
MTQFKKEIIRPKLTRADLFDKAERAAIETAFEIPDLLAFRFRFGWSQGGYTCEPTQGAEYLFDVKDADGPACKRWQDLRATAAVTRLALADVALNFAASTRIQTYLERVEPSPFYDKESSVEILLMKGCMVISDEEFSYRDVNSGGVDHLSAMCCTIVTERVKSSHEALKRMKDIEAGYAQYCSLNRALLSYQLANNIQMKAPNGDDWAALSAQD